MLQLSLLLQQSCIFAAANEAALLLLLAKLHCCFFWLSCNAASAGKAAFCILLLLAKPYCYCCMELRLLHGAEAVAWAAASSAAVQHLLLPLQPFPQPQLST
jgi:hypothetical protein